MTERRDSALTVQCVGQSGFNPGVAGASSYLSFRSISFFLALYLNTFESSSTISNASDLTGIDRQVSCIARLRL